MLQCDAMWCSVVRCVTVWCSVVQCHSHSGRNGVSCCEASVAFVRKGGREIESTHARAHKQQRERVRTCGNGLRKRRRRAQARGGREPPFLRMEERETATLHHRNAALQCTVMHCNALKCPTAHCNTLQHTATHSISDGSSGSTAFTSRFLYLFLLLQCVAVSLSSHCQKPFPLHTHANIFSVFHFHIGSF